MGKAEARLPDPVALEGHQAAHQISSIRGRLVQLVSLKSDPGRGRQRQQLFFDDVDRETTLALRTAQSDHVESSSSRHVLQTIAIVSFRHFLAPFRRLAFSPAVILFDDDSLHPGPCNLPRPCCRLAAPGERTQPYLVVAEHAC